MNITDVILNGTVVSIKDNPYVEEIEDITYLVNYDGVKDFDVKVV